MHVVVTAVQTPPKKVRIDLKAWATRCLKKQFDPERENWWAERGSIRHIHNEETLTAAIFYTLEAQDRKTEVTRSVGEGLLEDASHPSPTPDETRNPSLTRRVTRDPAKEQP